MPCVRADHLRARRAAVPPGGWTKCLYTLYAGCVCVLVRGIFRTIEFGTGTGGDDKGYLLSIEAWLVRSTLPFECFPMSSPCSEV